LCATSPKVVAHLLTMKKLMIMAGLVFALGATGCKDDFDKALGEAETLTNKMCACKDTACADKVREQRASMKERFRGALKDKKPDEDQMKRASAIDDKWRTCADKIENPS
jgi:hypothetical protein